jgi:hypothetical protein
LKSLGLAVEALLFIQCSKLDTKLADGVLNDLGKPDSTDLFKSPPG